MAARMSELEPRVIERLRAELAELIAANVAYPPYFDFRSNRLVTRPIDRVRMDEIQRFLSSVNFAPLERADVTSAETRRFLERLIVRYLDVNEGLRSRYAARHLPRMRAVASRVAAEAQRRATGFLNGSVPDFGARRQTQSWATILHRQTPRSGEERERAARVLESALLQRAAPADAAPIIGQARPPAASAPDPWRGQPNDLTIPVPATGFAPSGSGGSPYSAFGDGSSAGNGGAPATGYPPPARVSEQPTGPLATPPAGAAGAAGQANRASMRELPPDLYQLYGDYLNDMEPEAAVRAAPHPPQQQPAPPPRPATRQQAPAPPSNADARNDQLIFWQLRYQLEAYVRRAARSYGVPHQGGDPATVLDELRRSGFVDEADLRIAEGVFALTDRVTAQGHATEQEYRQALMLYLLYHRSHLNI